MGFKPKLTDRNVLSNSILVNGPSGNSQLNYFIDAHTHLNSDEIFPNRKEHITSFINLGGRSLINVGVDAQRNERAISIAQESLELFGDSCVVKATVGGHPSLVSYGTISSEEHIAKFIKQLENDLNKHSNHIVAIGECGMDAHYPGWGKSHCSLQQQFFYEQIQLAVRYKLPIVIHSRDAFSETIEVLQEFPELPIYMHCWGYGLDEIEQIINGFESVRIGFCGNVSYPKAFTLRDSLIFLVNHERFIDHHCGLLLETDAPWLSIQSKRGQINKPEYIGELYSFVAEYLGWTKDQIMQRVATDYTRFLAQSSK